MNSKIGIIGHGNVGSALERGLRAAGYDVRTAGRDAEAVREAGAWADVLVLAVPFGAVDETLRELDGTYAGKPLVDVTNALGPKMELAVGYSTSGAEELQKKAPKARVVKAFNTVFAQHMDKGELDSVQLTAFAAGDDEGAKATVLEMAKKIGFDAVDAGPLHNARWLETLGYLNIQLGYVEKMGTTIGFKLVHEQGAASSAE
jgi:predicted dinucleotide-binding enzyme